MVTLAETIEDAQEIANYVDDWATKWRMHVGTKKCLVLKTGKSAKNTENMTQLYFQQTNSDPWIQVGNKYKYLGVNFTSSRSFQTHYKYIEEKITKKLKFYIHLGIL